MATASPPARALHPVDALPLLGEARTWALELGGVGAASAVLLVGMPVLASFLVFPEAPVRGILYCLEVMFSMGLLGGATGATIGRVLCGLIVSRWPMPLSTLRWNLRTAGAAWVGLLSGGSTLLGSLALGKDPIGVVLLTLLGGGAGAAVVPGLVRAYLQAWLDRVGRRTVLLVMISTITGVGMLPPVFALLVLKILDILLVMPILD